MASSQSINVGFDAKRYFNNKTGLGNYSRWLVNGLKETNLSITLFNPRKEGTDLNLVSSKSKLTKSVWRSKWITKDDSFKNLDIYHGLSNELPFGIHKTNVRSVVTIHDLINFRYPENYKPIDRIIYQKKLEYAAKVANIIITPSQQTKRDVVHFLKADDSKIKVIPISVGPSIPPLPSHGNTVLCISSFSKRKNLIRLIDAFLRIKDKDLKLIIAGSKGDTYNQVNELAGKYPQIELKNNLSSSKINELYSKALFCIYPSLFEGFGIPILEAFAHNKLVATSNISSMPEVGGDVAVYFNPESVSEITQAIDKLSDSSIRKGREALIPQHLKHFDSAPLLSQYLDIYKQLV